jgi:hypothetical protein
VKAVWVVLIAVAIVMAVSASSASAFETSLSSADVQAAKTDGINLGREHQGYPMADYAIYAVANSLILLPSEGSIDAVVLATPYERVCYAAYLQTFQDLPVTQSDLSQAERPYMVDFIVFAHSATGSDAHFLTRFSKPRITIERFGSLLPVWTSSFGPALDFYTIPGLKRVLRFLGYNTYRFDLRSLAQRGADVSSLSGTFSLTDPYGRSYDWNFALGKYR